MSALDSFLTGFFGQVKTIQDKNKERADTYFDEQLKRAQTIGLEKISQRKAKVAEANAVANRLMRQGGVPADVVKEVARGGLDKLTELEQVWADAASSGVTVDETYWREVYGVAKTQAERNGTDINGAINEAVGLTKPQKESTTEAPKKKRSFGDYVFLSDSMERAQSRLEDTMLEDGLSAADVLRMENDPTPSSSVGPNWSVTADREREVKRRQGENLSTSEVKSMNDDYEKRVEEYTLSIMNDEKFSVENPDFNERKTAARKKAEERALSELGQIYGPDRVKAHPRFGGMVVTTEESTITEEVVPGPEAAQVANDTMKVLGDERAPKSERPDNVVPTVKNKGKTYTFSHITKEGKYVYKDDTGAARYVDPQYAIKAGSAPVEEKPQAQEVQERLNNALKAFVDGSGDTAAMDSLFIGRGENPPANITMPNVGVLTLKDKTNEGYVYGLADNDEQDVLIPSQ